MPITGHLLLESPMISQSGNDAWFSMLLALPIGLIYVTMLWRLHQLHQGAHLAEILLRTYGKWIGSMAISLFVIYGLYVLSITLYCIIDFTLLIYLQDYSALSIVSSLYVVMMYALYVGIECVARASEPLALLFAITGSSTGFANLTYKDYSRVLPILENGLAPIMHGILIMTALFGEIIIMLMFRLQKNRLQMKHLLYLLLTLVLFICLTSVGATMGTLAIFGVESSVSKIYPTYDVLKLVSYGFINRFDIYGIITVVTGGLIRLVLWQIAVNELIHSIVPVVRKPYIHVFIFLMISIVVLWMIPDSLSFHEYWVKSIYPLTVWITIAIPVLTWVISEFRWKSTSSMTRTHISEKN